MSDEITSIRTVNLTNSDGRILLRIEVEIYPDRAMKYPASVLGASVIRTITDEILWHLKIAMKNQREARKEFERSG